MDTERKQFEAFAKRRGMGVITISCGRYKSSCTQAMWESWQKSREAMRAAIAKGEGHD